MAFPLALLPPLVGLAVELVPPLAGRLFGQKTAEAASDAFGRVEEMVEEVAGTRETASVREALRADPRLGVELARRLAELDHELELALVAAERDDRAGARSTLLALVAAGDPLRWGAGVVSVGCFALFTLCLVAPWRGVTVEPGMLETVKNAFLAAVFFWLGHVRSRSTR